MDALTLARPGRLPGRRRRVAALGVGPSFRVVVLVLTTFYFLVPLLASTIFSFQGVGGRPSLASYQAVFAEPLLWPTLTLSLEIALGTIVLTLLLILPTVVWVNLRLPHLRRLMETLSLLPLATPAVVLVLGIFAAFRGLPQFIIGTPVIVALEYVVLAMPYSYRVIDAGVQAIDVHTLVDASRSLGASWPQVLLRVLMPNLQGAILSASFLTLALCLGEYAVASLLTFNTFPVWLVQVGLNRAGEAVALSTFALVFTWGLLLVISFGTARRRRRPRVAAARGGQVKA